MYFQIHLQDTKLRFVAKFVENRPLRSCQKVSWITRQKNSGSSGLVPALILPKMGRLRPKFPEHCHPLKCPRIPNLVRICCALPDLFRKYWFFGPRSNYNIGFQPTINLKHYISRCRRAVVCVYTVGKDAVCNSMRVSWSEDGQHPWILWCRWWD